MSQTIFTLAFTKGDTLAALNDNFTELYTTAGTLTTSLAGKAAIDLTLNLQSDSYELVLSDDGKYIQMNKGTAQNLTVPANASVAFAIGAQVIIRNYGAGQVTIVEAVGVTVNTSQTLKLRAQHCSASLVKVGTNEWDLSGDLELV